MIRVVHPGSGSWFFLLRHKGTGFRIRIRNTAWACKNFVRYRYLFINIFYIFIYILLIFYVVCRCFWALTRRAAWAASPSGPPPPPPPSPWRLPAHSSPPPTTSRPHSTATTPGSASCEMRRGGRCRRHVPPAGKQRWNPRRQLLPGLLEPLPPIGFVFAIFPPPISARWWRVCDKKKDKKEEA